MQPVPATDDQVVYWAARDGCSLSRVTIGGPAEGPDVIPCPALVGDMPVARADGSVVQGRVFHICVRLDEIEVAQLAQGATLWLTTWGSLPIHHLMVLPPSGVPGRYGE